MNEFLRMRSYDSTSVFWIGVVLFVVSVGGCFGTSQSESHSRLAALSQLYDRFQRSHSRRPVSVDELREYARGDGAALLAEFGIPDADALFISERDGKPFHLNIGQGLEGTGPLGYEQEGLDGKRMVAFSGGSAQLLTEEVFQQMLAEQ